MSFKVRKGWIFIKKKKLTCFARPPQFAKRMAFMLIGIIIQGFGLAILRRIDLGVDPCSCLTQGVVNHTGLSFGTCQLLCHIVTFVFVIKFDMSYIGFGTIGNMCFLGYISDFFAWLSQSLPAELFTAGAARYIMLAPGLGGLLFGAALYMCAGLGASPYDALPFIISSHIKRLPFKLVRILWDALFMSAGFLLGGTVGIVTAAVVLFCGPVVSWVQRRLQRAFVQVES